MKLTLLQIDTHGGGLVDRSPERHAPGTPRWHAAWLALTCRRSAAMNAALCLNDDNIDDDGTNKNNFAL